MQRLNRYLDWRDSHRRVKSSRNAALCDALSMWLEDQEQQAGLSTSRALHRQFKTAYHSLRQRPGEVRIHHLRDVLGWPRERFDAVLEHLRAEEHAWPTLFHAHMAWLIRP